MHSTCSIKCFAGQSAPARPQQTCAISCRPLFGSCTHDRAFRKRFAALAERREQALRSAFRQAGVDALELSTSDDLVDAILRFADLRKRRSQLAAGGSLPQHLTRI